MRGSKKVQAILGLKKIIQLYNLYSFRIFQFFIIGNPKTEVEVFSINEYFETRFENKN